MTDRIGWTEFKTAYLRIHGEITRRDGRSGPTARGQIDGLDLALMEMEDAFRHVHVRSDNLDICALCGLDLRNGIHIQSKLK